jgi:hypothetical protein
VYKKICTTQYYIDTIKYTHTFKNVHIKFYEKFKISLQKSEKFSTSKYSMCIAHMYTFNTVHNINTHTLLDITDIIKVSSLANFEIR